MKQPGYILALDQGTTGTTAILVDGSGRPIWQATQEIAQIYPQPGWVEHDPEEIFQSCMTTIEELLEETEVGPRQIQALGITNQRETTLVWERESGQPVANAVVTWIVIRIVAVGFHSVSFSTTYSQQGAVQLAPPYGIRWKSVSGPKKMSDFVIAAMRVEPVFFTQASANVAASWPVAWMISTLLLSLSSATSADETRTVPTRRTASSRS